MEDPAPTERQALVGDVTLEAVHEPHRAGAVRDDEAGDPAQPLTYVVRWLVDHLGESADLELSAEDGGDAQQLAVGPVELVDGGTDQPLQRVGQQSEVGAVAPVGDSVQQLAQEQRVAGRPRRQDCARAGDQRPVLSHDPQQIAGLVVRQRLEGQLERVDHRIRPPARIAGPSGDQDEPGAVVHHGCDVVEQVGGGVVQAVGVLHEQDGGSGPGLCQQLRGLLVSDGSPELRSEGCDLGGVGQLDADGRG